MTTNLFPAMQSVAERTRQQSVALRSLAKRIANTLRCGLPGVITEFDYSTQYATVRLAITENLINLTGGGFTETSIPDLRDVLVMLPGDAYWCLTFPNLVGSECYVCFADMCINAWSTHGFKEDSNGKLMPQKQELMRRHDLSDGFAILAPRSQPKRIHDYATNAVELRSLDNDTKISLSNDGKVKLQADTLEIDGIDGGVIGGTPTNATFCLPIKIDGVTWYMKLSAAP